MPDVAVDIGNTRMKWGRCSPGGVADVVSLPADSQPDWEAQLAEWDLDRPARWAVASVHPFKRDRFVAWLRERGNPVQVIDRHTQLPLDVHVDLAAGVGIDRLLDAVGANARRRPGVPAVIVDAGTAVTVDLVDGEGAFRGGFILPGLRLMARALNDHTALLPLVEDFRRYGPIPPGNTEDAIREGVRWGLLGAVERLTRLLAERCDGYHHLHPFLTGGDAALLREALPAGEVCPSLTLEGIRITADAER